MDYVTLGRTGLRVSVLGLGGGGHSRLGQQTGGSEDGAVAIVRRAVEQGINFIDTAEVYGTEPAVGRALRSLARQDVVLSTKKTLSVEKRMISGAELIAGLDASLARLGTEYVDIYHLHGVRPEQYERAFDELVPALITLREAGKIRFLGITEAFAGDTSHHMLARALEDDCWDVIMVGFNMLNQSACGNVLAVTQRNNIGVLCMYAVRDALSQPAKLRELVAELVARGEIDRDALDPNDPLRFVREAAGSLPDAAYRFCRAEPGIHVVLSGTGNPDHLDQNIASIMQPPLPAHVQQRLIELFGHVDSVSGQ